MYCRQVIADGIHVPAMDIGLARLDDSQATWMKPTSVLQRSFEALNGLTVFLSAHPLQTAVPLDLEVVYRRNYHPRWGLGWRL